MESPRLIVRSATTDDLPFLQRTLYEAANRPGTAWPEFEVSLDETRNRRFWSGWMREGDIGVGDTRSAARGGEQCR